MKKNIITEKQMSWVMLIALFITPFVLIAIGSEFGYEMEARLIGITIFCLLPLFLVFYLIFGPEEYDAEKKGQLLVVKFFTWIFSIFFIVFVSYPIFKDAYNFIGNPIPVRTGIIEDTGGRGHAQIIIGYQTLYLDDINGVGYSTIYDKTTYFPGQRVKIHYLPNSEYILKTEILDE